MLNKLIRAGETFDYKKLIARRPTKVAAIALANKIARTAWAMMTKGERYRFAGTLTAREAANYFRHAGYA